MLQGQGYLVFCLDPVEVSFEN